MVKKVFSSLLRYLWKRRKKKPTFPPLCKTLCANVGWSFAVVRWLELHSLAKHLTWASIKWTHQTLEEQKERQHKHIYQSADIFLLAAAAAESLTNRNLLLIRDIFTVWPSESSDKCYLSQLWTLYLVVDNKGGKDLRFLLRKYSLYIKKTVLFGITFENIIFEIISLNTRGVFEVFVCISKATMQLCY